MQSYDNLKGKNCDNGKKIKRKEEKGERKEKNL